MDRVLEPELMDTPEEAREYDAMDHALVNDVFCADLLAAGELGPAILDVGTGTAQIPIALCKKAPSIRVVAIDLADHMLALARDNVARAGLGDRVMLERVDAKAMPYDDSSFTATVSNSIIHHIPEPVDSLREMIRVTKSGGLVFVRDLCRPESDKEVERLVDRYGGERPVDPSREASFEHQRALLHASFKAALTVAEIADLAARVGIDRSAVRMTSDRHWTLSFRKP